MAICKYCKGNGKRECNTCNGVPAGCNYCSEKGIVQCPHCRGSGIFNRSENILTTFLIVILILFCCFLIYSAFNYFTLQNYSDKYTAMEDAIQQSGKAIDLLNIVLVSGGILITAIGIFIALQVNRWERQHKFAESTLKETEDKYVKATKDLDSSKETLVQTKEMLATVQNLNIDYTKIIENFDQKLEDTRKDLENTTHYINGFYTRYARGLSKYYSKNYKAAIEEFQDLINFVKKSVGNSNENELKQLDDVHFHLGRANFRMIDFDKQILDKERKTWLSESSKNYEIAKNLFEMSENWDNAANSLALKALSNSYLINTNIPKGSKPLTDNIRQDIIDGIIKDLDEVIERVNGNTSYGSQKKSKSYIPLYNVACTYSVLYNYTQNENYKYKALKYLEYIYNGNIIKKEYILSDPDWIHFVDFPPKENSIDKNSKDHQEIVYIIDEFFMKKNSRWEITKLYALLAQNPSQDLYRNRALEMLWRCFDSHLVSEEQISSSETFKVLLENWKDYKEIKMKEKNEQKSQLDKKVRIETIS